MARLSVRGKALWDGERKFHVRGVSYGTFRPNSRGEQYPEPERVAADFSLMRELGVNVVRTYVPAPRWVLEAAHKAGLRLLIGVPGLSHMAFLDSRALRREIRQTVCTTVSEASEFHDAIFAFSLGNEIRSDIVRWHGPKAVSGFLSELYDAAKQLDSESLFTYCNYPSTEYLDLSFLDLICFNVYLHREADFRRYLTHLLAISGDRPLVLSETGMDTIREGEAAQAALLKWQSRAAFEVGLSGLIIFAFTDEWYTGGSEITDWAFGLVTCDRSKKPAFAAVAELYRGSLPPELVNPPKISVIVAAYNAEATLAQCLASLKRLNYPDYEIIAVDDGSSDRTPAIAEGAGVRVLRLEHRGLSAARNAGVEATSAPIVAFIDADASAERDWLYHLTQALSGRDCAAAGGPNFAPPSPSALVAAIAVAPGTPREVRLGDDQLAQLCGCNMAIRRSALKAVDGFDAIFDTAGDDVDLSWRLRDSGETLAYAPAAVVIHQRRQTVAGYLAQQRGYGRGEAILFRKHPYRAQDGMYLDGRATAWSRLFGTSGRIYYGAFGRGLFQTIYPASNQPGPFDLALTAEWIVVSTVLLLTGLVNPIFGWLGLAAVLTSMLAAMTRAASCRLDRPPSRIVARLMLWTLWLAGPILRSFEREKARWFGALPIAPLRGRSRLRARGRLELKLETPGDSDHREQRLLDAIRTALIRRGLAVAPGGGFSRFDLEVLINPLVGVALNGMVSDRGRLALLWRVRPRPAGMVVFACLAGLVALAMRHSPAALGVALGSALVLFAFWTVPSMLHLEAALEGAALEGTENLGLRPEVVRAKRAA